MIQVSKFISKYPSIGYYFTQEWFELELTKKEEDMHLLAKRLLFYGDDDEDFFIYYDHVERCLKELKDCIDINKKHFKRLLHKEGYESQLAELEIGLMLKDMNFNIVLEPQTQGGKKSDIKIISANPEIFVEVSIKKGIITKWEDIETYCSKNEIFMPIHYENHQSKIGIFKIRFPINFTEKITSKTIQLSKTNPSILALVIEPSSRNEINNIIRGFGFSLVLGNGVHIELGEPIDNSLISALLIYCYEIGEKEVNYTVFCNNPLAKFPLPESVSDKFENYCTRIIKPSISE